MKAGLLDGIYLLQLGAKPPFTSPSTSTLVRPLIRKHHLQSVCQSIQPCPTSPRIPPAIPTNCQPHDVFPATIPFRPPACASGCLPDGGPQRSYELHNEYDGSWNEFSDTINHQNNFHDVENFSVQFFASGNDSLSI